MKYITLSGGKKTMVDDDVFENLNKYKWGANKQRRTFYAGRALPRVGKKRPHQYMHSVIMKTPRGMQVDHIDGDGLNNQKNNLRICTNRENHFNLRKSTRNTSGITGVCWRKDRKKWQSYIGFDCKQIHLGYFVNKFDARKAYIVAQKKYYGKFAKL